MQFARAGAIYTGVELSRNSLDLAQSRFHVYGLDGKLIEGDAENLESLFLGETFDLIFSFGVLHHTPSIQAALIEIRKLCAENTVFKFMVYAKHSWKAAMISAGLDQPEAQFGCPIANVYSKEEIEKLLEEAGFSLVECNQAHIFPYKIPEYLRYEYVLHDWFAAMPNEVFSALEKNLGWHLLITAKPV